MIAARDKGLAFPSGTGIIKSQDFILLRYSLGSQPSFGWNNFGRK